MIPPSSGRRGARAILLVELATILVSRNGHRDGLSSGSGFSQVDSRMLSCRNRWNPEREFALMTPGRKLNLERPSWECRLFFWQKRLCPSYLIYVPSSRTFRYSSRSQYQTPIDGIHGWHFRSVKDETASGGSSPTSLKAVKRRFPRLLWQAAFQNEH